MCKACWGPDAVCPTCGAEADTVMDTAEGTVYFCNDHPPESIRREWQQALSRLNARWN